MEKFKGKCEGEKRKREREEKQIERKKWKKWKKIIYIYIGNQR